MNITRDPIVTNLTNTTAIIRWESDSTNVIGQGLLVAESGSDYVFVPAVSNIIVTSTGAERCVHVTYLLNLLPDSMFSFKVVGPSFESSYARSYVTLSPTGSLKLGILNTPEGFFGATYPGMQYTMDEMGEIDAYLSCGGIVPRFASQTYEDWDAWVTAVTPYLLDSGVLMARGTDDNTLTGSRMFPTNFPGRQYFTAFMGPAAIMVLDTSIAGRASLAAGHQKNWAVTQFNSTEWKSASNRIILASDPFRVSLWDQSGSFGDGTGTDKFLMTHMLPLLEQSGADLAIFGKAHSYQRGVLESKYPNNDGNPIHHLVTGGIAPAHTVRCWNWEQSDAPGIIVESSTPHFVTIDVSTSGMTVYCNATSNGFTIDQFGVAGHTLI